jgi:putative cell wall-binding protein
VRRVLACGVAVALTASLSATATATAASVAAGSAQAASPAPTWTTKSPQHSAPLDASTMTFDGATGQVVLFGSSFDDTNGCPVNATFTWDGGSWAGHQQLNAPPERQTPTLGYDAATKQVVMFGGNAQGCYTPPGAVGYLGAVDDTWTWNGSIWTQQNPSAVPQAQEGGCAAYDQATGQFLMYGGYAPFETGPGDPDAQTWQWTGTNWVQLTPAATPPAGYCAMTYDPVRGELVMPATEIFTPASAADNGANDVLETWTWNGTNWTRAGDLRSPTSPATSLYFDNSLSFDPDAGTDLAYAQQVTACSTSTCPETDETWSFDGSAWSQTSTNTPQAGGTGGTVEDIATHQLIMFGASPGDAGTTKPVTWVYAAPGSSAASPTRLFGATRQGTAVAASTSEFPTAGSASAVVLARADDFADALAGGPLAARKKGPLLLTSSAALDAVTATEIQRVLPKGGTVYLLGGTSALSDAVATAIAALGDVATRIAGTDRYGTAVAIAGAMGNPTTVFEASGTNFPDAISAVPAAVANNGAILLTDGSAPAAATSAYLSTYATTRYAIGGPAAYADPSAIGIAGADRYATSQAVALAFFPDTKGVSIASGANFPDALAAGPLAGTAGEPVLLVPPTGALPEPITSYLATHAGGIASVQAFGGTAAVDANVLSEVKQAIG